MEENVTIMTVLQELRDFRIENNKRWEENDRRWEQNERRWKENDKRWEKNEERLTAVETKVAGIETKVGSLETKVDSIETRVESLEEGRKTDKREILDVLDRMQKSMSHQFAEMKDYIDAKFAKIDLALTVNDIEHIEFRQLLKAYGVRLDLYNNRITNLENWKQEYNGGQAIGVY
ncbi:MAG: hypothetical protein HFJ37_00380 [Clostridia bacterium]|nr:hypothetical protein [Clostridia bacterium]